MSWCDLISENGVEALSRGCPKLKRFSCKGCKRVNNNAVICLATYCNALEVLNLQGCDVKSFAVKYKLQLIDLKFYFAEHYRCSHSKNCRNMSSIEATMRFEMCRIDRSYVDFDSSAQCIFEYVGSCWLPSIHWLWISSLGQGNCSQLLRLISRNMHISCSWKYTFSYSNINANPITGNYWNCNTRIILFPEL